MNGVWSDIVAGDTSFIYTNGRPFGIEFANNNGNFRLLVRDLDNPTNIFRWQWSGPAAAATNRFGLTTWGSTDAHFTYVKASGLPVYAPLKITAINVAGGNVTLTISKSPSANYNVLRSTDVAGSYTVVATNQSSSTYTEPLPAGEANFYKLQLVP